MAEIHCWLGSSTMRFSMTAKASDWVVVSWRSTPTVTVPPVQSTLLRMVARTRDTGPGQAGHKTVNNVTKIVTAPAPLVLKIGFLGL